MKKVGIYAGTFDPIHDGHLEFALKALEDCRLDKIFFLVEPRPRRKQGVRALEHREAMVKLAIANDRRLGMIRLEQSNFSVEDTLPKLQALFEGAELNMLMGEDVFAHLHSWPHVDELLNACNFIIGIREGDNEKVEHYLQTVQKTRGIRFEIKVLVTDHQDISSSKIRLALKRHTEPTGLLPEVASYITKNGLYSELSEE